MDNNTNFGSAKVNDLPPLFRDLNDSILTEVQQDLLESFWASLPLDKKKLLFEKLPAKYQDL